MFNRHNKKNDDKMFRFGNNKNIQREEASDRYNIYFFLNKAHNLYTNYPL